MAWAKLDTLRDIMKCWENSCGLSTPKVPLGVHPFSVKGSKLTVMQMNGILDLAKASHFFVLGRQNCCIVNWSMSVFVCLLCGSQKLNPAHHLSSILIGWLEYFGVVSSPRAEKSWIKCWKKLNGIILWNGISEVYSEWFRLMYRSRPEIEQYL